MPAVRRLGAGWLARPLLELDRSKLLAHARAANLHWLEDPSNADQSLDRNYCRHTILPAIADRWPGYRNSWSKTITLAAEAATLLQELAAADLQLAQQPPTPNLAVPGPLSLSLAYLGTLSRARQRNVVRWWLAQAGGVEPGWHQLHELVNKLIPAAQQGRTEARVQGGADGGGAKAAQKGRAEARVQGHTLTVFQNRLYLLPPMPALTPGVANCLEPPRVRHAATPQQRLLNCHPNHGQRAKAGCVSRSQLNPTATNCGYVNARHTTCRPANSGRVNAGQTAASCQYQSFPLPGLLPPGRRTLQTCEPPRQNIKEPASGKPPPALAPPPPATALPRQPAGLHSGARSH